MRSLLLAVCVMLTACVSTSKPDEYLRTTGIGSTYEEAKHNAFKEAIEYQVGVVIASEREAYNDKLVKNEILAYSSAFVDEYKIISQQNIGTKIQVVIDVKLSLLRLSDRILSSGKDSKNIDGAKHYTQYTSFLENKQNGDKILSSILNDYPRRAYNIKQSDYTLKMDTYRNLTLIVPYEMHWNEHYINSLTDALNLVQDGSNGLMQKSPSTIRVVGNKFYFNEFIIPNKILDAMMDLNEVRIMVEVKDINNTLQHSECFTPDAVFRRNKPFYSINYVGTINVGINKSTMEKHKIEIKFNQNSKLASADISRIDLAIVPKKFCQKFI